MYVAIPVCLAIIAVQLWVISYMAWDRNYGCFTRAAYDVLLPILKALGYQFVFADIDRFKKVNTDLGYERANQLVQGSIRRFWRSWDFTFVFRYYSGDEFAIAVKDSANVVADRIVQAFVYEGLSITVIVADEGVSLEEIKARLSNKYSQ